MTSILDIANRALSAVGARSGAAGSVTALQSLNASSNEAFQVNLLLNPTRDDLLRAAHWNFARKTALLSLLKAAPGTPENSSTPTAWSSAYPPPPWLYSYGYPSDCLKMRSVATQARLFQRHGRLWLSGVCWRRGCWPEHAEIRRGQ